MKARWLLLIAMALSLVYVLMITKHLPKNGENFHHRWIQQHRQEFLVDSTNSVGLRGRRTLSKVNIENDDDDGNEKELNLETDYDVMHSKHPNLKRWFSEQERYYKRDMVQEIWQATRDGNINSTVHGYHPKLETPSKSSDVGIWYEILKSRIPKDKPATLLEIHGLSGHRYGTGGEIGILLARDRKNFDIIALGIGNDFGQELLFRDVIRIMGLTNMMFAQSQLDISSPILESFRKYCNPIVDYLVISSPLAIAKDSGPILAHEYEKMLGSLLLIARKTYILSPLPNVGYFSSWNSQEDLLNASLEAARSIIQTLDCPNQDIESAKIEPIRNDRNEDKIDSTLEWMWTSDTVVPESPVKLFEVVISYSNQSKNPTSSPGIPLEFLNILDLSHFNRQKLFVKLALKHNGRKTYDETRIHHGDVIIKDLKPIKIESDSEDDRNNNKLEIDRINGNPIKEEQMKNFKENVQSEPFITSYVLSIWKTINPSNEETLNDTGNLYKTLSMILPSFKDNTTTSFTYDEFATFMIEKLNLESENKADVDSEESYRSFLQEKFTNILESLSDIDTLKTTQRHLLSLVNDDDSSFRKLISSPGTAQRLEAEMLPPKPVPDNSKHDNDKKYNVAHIDPGLEFDYWWPTVKSLLKIDDTVLTIGTAVASIGSKLATKTEELNTIFVSIVDSESQGKLFSDANDNLGIHNQIICTPKQGSLSNNAMQSVLSTYSSTASFSYLFIGIDAILNSFLPSFRRDENSVVDSEARERFNEFVDEHWAGWAFPAQLYGYSTLLPDESRSLEDFETRIGYYLQFGKSVIVCLPSWNALNDALKLVLPNTKNSKKFLELINERYKFDKMGSKKGWENVFRRSLKISKTGHFTVLHSIGSNFIARWSNDDDDEQKVENNFGVSLYTLVGFDVFADHRRDLFRMYLDLPISAIYSEFGPNHSMNPWDVHLRSHRGSLYLEYSVVSKQKKIVKYVSKSFSSNKDQRASIILDEIEKENEILHSKFNLLNLYSGLGSLSLSIARRHKSSTIVSIEPKQSHANTHAREAMETNVSNDIVCNGVLSKEQLVKFYESPEFFRFQVLGGNLIDHIRDTKSSQPSFSRTMGHILGLSMTTFLEIPSAKAFSLAFATFFPPPSLPLIKALRFSNSRFGVPYAPGWPIDAIKKLTPRYSFDIHPLNNMRKIRSVLLGKLTSSNQDTDSIKVQLSVLKPRIRQSKYDDVVITTTEMIRIDLVNMTRTVHHHFDHAVDGHERTYKLHVVRNFTTEKMLHRFEQMQPSSDIVYPRILKSGNHRNGQNVLSVYLIRQKDNVMIPYEEIRYFTLVSALRIGMVDSIKERSWRKFLELPLYEDMAPWNIVFQGSEMQYIDYDTRQITYDDQVANVYRVLSVLYNYKRTVSDFGKCGEKAKTQYNFGFVSDCVGVESSDDDAIFSWDPVQVKEEPKDEPLIKPPKKCPSSKYPVPCPDGNCHTDYITCLRAMEKQNQILGNPQQQKEQKKYEETKYLQSNDIWTFDSKGIKIDTMQAQG